MEKCRFLFVRSDNKWERINVFYYIIERTTLSNDIDISGMTQLNGLQSWRIWRFNSLKIGRKKCHPMARRKTESSNNFCFAKISITIYGNDEAFHLNFQTLFIDNSDIMHASTGFFSATATILFRNAIGRIILLISEMKKSVFERIKMDSGDPRKSDRTHSKRNKNTRHVYGISKIFLINQFEAI